MLVFLYRHCRLPLVLALVVVAVVVVACVCRRRADVVCGIVD